MNEMSGGVRVYTYMTSLCLRPSRRCKVAVLVVAAAFSPRAIFFIITVQTGSAEGKEREDRGVVTSESELDLRCALLFRLLRHVVRRQRVDFNGLAIGVVTKHKHIFIITDSTC